MCVHCTLINIVTVQCTTDYFVLTKKGLPHPILKKLANLFTFTGGNGKVCF